MRYTGSVQKKSRGLGFSLLETGKELQKRPYGPGQHGSKKQKKANEYKTQITEKQKLAYLYGVTNRQFTRLFERACKKKDIDSGLNFLRILERRLDNLVYRAGFAATRRSARQLVSHKHILVNGKKVNIPSFLCEIGDVISVSDKYPHKEKLKKTLEENKNTFPTLKLDKNNLSATFIREVNREELSKNINENAIIEWFNR